MGFHIRHIDENYLRTEYDKKGNNGIIVLYSTADAIDSADEFSSQVTDIFCRNLSKTEICKELEAKFDSSKYAEFIHRKLSAFKILSSRGIEEAVRLYPEEENFLKTNQRLSFSDVEKILIQQF